MWLATQASDQLGSGTKLWRHLSSTENSRAPAIFQPCASTSLSADTVHPYSLMLGLAILGLRGSGPPRDLASSCPGSPP